MKVENKGPIPIDSRRNLQKKDSVTTAKADSTEASSKDQVNAKLSRTLDDTVEAISISKLSAGDVHSKVDSQRASGLLHSMEIDGKRPRLTDEQILDLADKVAAQQQESPATASKAFYELDGSRVADLV